jgi:hypothetical protein
MRVDVRVVRKVDSVAKRRTAFDFWGLVEHTTAFRKPIEKRIVPRLPFVAGAEVSEEGSGIKIKTRVTELSLHGCYLDMLNPLPEGTAVSLKIVTDTNFFEGKAIVRYSHPRLGVGLSFRDLSPHSLAVLKGWLLKALKADEN